jgi:mutual gliding-motility protein MglA
MVQFNMQRREVALKIVYYGPPLSGKTTNLQALFTQADRLSRGRLVTLETRDDRTIYFDMLPVFVSSASGHRLSFKLYTVPGQPLHNATRRVVLRGADALVFVASSERRELAANRQSWSNLRRNLAVDNVSLRDVPVVIQFNKQDLPEALSAREIAAVAEYSGLPTHPATALEGKGVRETLLALVMRLFEHLCDRHDFSRRLGTTREEFAAHVKQVFGMDDERHGPIRLG